MLRQAMISLRKCPVGNQSTLKDLRYPFQHILRIALNHVG